MNELSPLTGEYTPAEAETLKDRLFELTKTQTDSYTQLDSTSVRIEVAEALLKSLTFSLSAFALEKGKAPLLENADWGGILKASQEIICAKTGSARRLYMKVRATAPKTASRAYHETLASIGAGFKKYDFVFFAHEFPASIDYQLSIPVEEERLGIDYIDEYLSRLLIENRFVGRFNKDAVASAVNGVQDFYETYENIYETVATRILTRALIGADINRLFFDEAESQAVRARLLPLSLDEAVPLMRKKALAACTALGVTDEKDSEYLAYTAEAFTPRLMAALA